MQAARGWEGEGEKVMPHCLCNGLYPILAERSRWEIIKSHIWSDTSHQKYLTALIGINNLTAIYIYIYIYM